MLGSKACVEYALNIGVKQIEQRVKYLADLCRQKLNAIPGIENLDKGSERCGITTYAVTGWHPNAIKTTLAAQAINVSTLLLNSALIDFKEKGADWALRVSPHYYNTAAEIDTLSEVLSELMPKR